MERVREILIQYAKADFSQRIYLFLQFPGLRDVFQEIERKRYYLFPLQSNGIAREDVLCSYCSSVGSAR
ncbi:MAG: hypothetical protein A2Z08_02525 [Deltaproteobacteria bacterium RBG_16_54_11]|jgi:hypothetical protein|nr:MAG: hypothetical protein A2Z08_02525 [Deltaproteobacteria bacterium RBG_16_54_11]